MAEVGRVWGVLLAAGRSRRFGGGLPKQLLPFEGEPLVRRAARTALASGLDGVLAVVGHAAREVEEALDGLEVRTVLNPDHAKGLASSVRAGLAAVPGEAAGALFLTADQPLLSAEIVDRLLAAFRETGGPIVLPSAEGRRGSPVLFHRSLFGELAAVQGDAGGRQVVSRHPEAVVEVPLESATPLEDVDSPEDYRRLTAEPAGAAGHVTEP